MSKKFNVAVVGATGMVGEVMLSILAQRQFPVQQVFALASARSAGNKVAFGGRELVVAELDGFDFSQAEIGLFSAGASVSDEYAPLAAAASCVVIDNTSRFRYEDDIPLVVPEVNPDRIADYTNRGIIANPNCSTIQMVVALKPIHDAVGISRINVATYQAVSGAGRQAVDDLHQQTAAVLEVGPADGLVYPRHFAFNALPQIDTFQDNGYTREEMKMIWETQKILGDDSIRVNPTTVRVPVFVGHSEAVHIETRDRISAQQARALLAQSPGIVVVDEQADGGYPTAIEAAGTNPVYVGRIREDISHDKGLNLWVVADNIRKGAALNSVQIAEILVQHYLQGDDR
ncbi:MAG: aspartate-semialdehyde dehydrogenase [Gammaproteobacteria bacterium]